MLCIYEQSDMQRKKCESLQKDCENEMCLWLFQYDCLHLFFLDNPHMPFLPAMIVAVWVLLFWGDSIVGLLAV